MLDQTRDVTVTVERVMLAVSQGTKKQHVLNVSEDWTLIYYEINVNVNLLIPNLKAGIPYS